MIQRCIVLIWLLMTSAMAYSAEALIPLDKGWRFYQSDNIAMSAVNLPDNSAEGWHEVDTTALLHTNSTDGIYGWYQVTFDWEQDPTEDWVLYIQSIRYGDETWLNGQQIGGLGQVLTPWDFITPTPQNMVRAYSIPKQILRTQNNVLAVKVNLGIGQVWGAMYPGGVGISGDIIAIGTPEAVNDAYFSQVLKDTRFDTVLVLLGVVDLFIIIFLFRRSIHHFREFWWLLISSLVLMLGSLMLDYGVVPIARPNGLKLSLIFSILVAPLTSALYFRTIYLNVSNSITVPIAVFWLILIGLIMLPNIPDIVKEKGWLVWTALAMLTYLYCLLSVIKGIKQRNRGAILQLTGLLVYILSIRTQWLPHDFYEHRNIIIGTLAFRYALLFSYFQRINQMSYDYKKLSSRLLTTIELNKKEIARDLHDDLGQHLSAAKLQLLLYYQGETEDSMKFIKEEIDAAIRSTREMMEGLHPIYLEQYHFSEAIQRETERLARLYKVEIQLDIAKVDFDKVTEKQLFRICQEALHNAIRHGQASMIHIQLVFFKRYVHLTVTDNGNGFNLDDLSIPQQGFGLVSLRERVALINGNLQLDSIIEKGTVVKITLPYRQVTKKKYKWLEKKKVTTKKTQTWFK